MVITTEWFKEHFLCVNGLADVTYGFTGTKEASIEYTHNEIIDKYIKTNPDWMGFFTGMLISSDIERLKVAIELVERYLHLINEDNDEAIDVFLHIKKMVFETNNFALTQKIVDYLDNKENRKNNKTFIPYILCLYIKLSYEKEKEYMVKALGAIVEAIVFLERKNGSEANEHKYYYKAALVLRKLLDKYLVE